MTTIPVPGSVGELACGCRRHNFTPNIEAPPLLLIPKASHLPAPARMLQLPQRLCLDLPNPFAGHRELLADLLERVIGIVIPGTLNSGDTNSGDTILIRYAPRLRSAPLRGEWSVERSFLLRHPLDRITVTVHLLPGLNT